MLSLVLLLFFHLSFYHRYFLNRRERESANKSHATCCPLDSTSPKNWVGVYTHLWRLKLSRRQFMQIPSTEWWKSHVLWLHLLQMKESSTKLLSCGLHKWQQNWVGTSGSTPCNLSILLNSFSNQSGCKPTIRWLSSVTHSIGWRTPNLSLYRTVTGPCAISNRWTTIWTISVFAHLLTSEPSSGSIRVEFPLSRDSSQCVNVSWTLLTSQTGIFFLDLKFQIMQYQYKLHQFFQ